jgi:aminopeptidase N
LLRFCAALLALSGGSSVAAANAPSSGAGTDLAPLQTGLDYHSFANVEQFRVTHLELDLRVDFTNKVLFGAVTLEIKRLDPSATELVLDTRELDVRSVEEKAIDVLGATAKSQTTWVSRPFHLDRADPILGSPLVIELSPSKKPTELIKIEYLTAPSSAAVQWLTPKQTSGGHRPFLYTSSEPIGARGWIPLQDTPQMRFTYTAHIHTSDDFLAVMSAKNDPKAKRNGEYSFDMPDAVPSYLIALAVGDLHFKETGRRSGIYAEKAVLAAAAKEFDDTEAMIRSAERSFGAYAWDRYDVVVLPPSFPLGGVANPRLSFISPAIIAGDKSLVSVVADALAHSWSGNLVSNATWRDAWLNEGFSAYLESRVMMDVYGERLDAMQRVLGLESLRAELAKLEPRDQALAIDLRGRDPAVALGTVASEKGRLFLGFLDAKFGRERFDAFLRGYFDHFAFKSLTTEQFLAYLDEKLLQRFPGIVTRDEAMEWVHKPGIPAEAVLPQSDAFQPVDAVRRSWLDGESPAKKLKTHDWLTPQWLYFLDDMPALSKEQLAQLDQAFDLTHTPNSEVAERWFLIVIRNAYQPSMPRLEQYLETNGLGRLITPLYAELMKTPAGAAMAKRIYARARAGYHPRTIAALEPIVNPRAEMQEDE